MDGLQTFILEAKAAAYVGNGSPSPACRNASHDIRYDRGPWHYLDSYFGGTDFLGQEVVWKDDDPVWAMNYYGRILDPELIDATITGMIIKEALSALYSLGRFLGAFEYVAGNTATSTTATTASRGSSESNGSTSGIGKSIGWTTTEASSGHDRH